MRDATLEEILASLGITHARDGGSVNDGRHVLTRGGETLGRYDGLLRDAQEMIARQRAEIAAISPIIEAARRRGDVDIDALVDRLAPIFNRKLRERA